MKTRLALLVTATSLLLCSCGSKSPTAPQTPTLPTVQATVVTPPGYPVDLTTTTVLASYGQASPVPDSSGHFKLQVPASGSLPIDLVNGAGQILMLGQASAAGGQISPKQTAVILAFYAVGGFLLPAADHDSLMTLLAQDPAVDALRQTVQVRLAANPTAIALGDAVLDTAVVRARAALLAGGTLGARARAGREAVPARAPKSARSSGLVLDPATMQSGIEILQNPSGSGVIAQNSFRRYATFLVYRTATEDANGTKTTLSPPVLVGSAHDIPSTSRLEFFSAISGVVTGTSPFQPVQTSAVDLPLVSGTSKTYYDLVVLGGAFESVYPPIFQDTRYFGVMADWNAQLDRLRFKSFWLDFAWPAIETFLFVRGAGGQQAKSDAFVTEFKSVCDRHLADLGVILRNGDPASGGPRVALHLALIALRDDQAFRLELIDACKRALDQSALNQADFQAMAQKLSARASAASIAAAINVALSVGDLCKVMADLGASRSGELWTATVSSPHVRLDPNPANVTQAAPGVSLTTTVENAGTNRYVYRWSTPGAYGSLSDVHGKQGKSFDSAYGTVSYLADVGAIVNGNLDVVTVQVYLDNGSGGAGTYVGTATSQITGTRDDGGNEGPVTITAYPQAEPSVDQPTDLTVNVQNAGAANTYHVTWTTAGNHGSLHANTQTGTTITDEWNVSYTPSAAAHDLQTEVVQVSVHRVSDGTLVGNAQITLTIWKPTQLYTICGDAAGQNGPRLGSGSSWTFILVGHGQLSGGGCYAHSGAKVHAYLQCNSATGCYWTGYNDIGPIYIRRGAIGDPADLSVMVFKKGDYGCTPANPATEPWCTVADTTVTLP